VGKQTLGNESFSATCSRGGGSRLSKTSTLSKSKTALRVLPQAFGARFGVQPSGTVPEEYSVPKHGELLLGISLMAPAEIQQFARRLQAEHQVQHASRGIPRGDKLCTAFRLRLAELLAAVPLGELSRAAETLSLLNNMKAPVERSTDPDNEACPQRSFERRVVHLAHKHRGELDVLKLCYGVTSSLVAKGLMEKRVHDAVMSCLRGYIERRPLAQLWRDMTALQEITCVETSLLSELEKRLVQRSQQDFQPGQLQAYARLLLEMRRHGVDVLGGPGVPVLHPPSVSMLPPLQKGVLQAFSESIRRWPLRRISEEFQGSILELCQECELVRTNLVPTASEKVVTGLEGVAAMVMRLAEPIRTQQELIAWSTYTQRAGKAGLVALAAPVGQRVLAGVEVHGSMAFCLAHLTPAAPELPPQYLPVVNKLRPGAQKLAKAFPEVRDLLEQCTSPEEEVDKLEASTTR